MGPDTVFLQQAAHLTGGSYLYLTETSALLQYLIVSKFFILPYHRSLPHPITNTDVLPVPSCHP